MIVTGLAVSAGANAVQLVPPSVVYSWLVIVAPPLLDDGVNVTVTWVSPTVALRPVGALGIARGVEITLAEAVPEPAAFTARSPRAYVVPFVRPVITTGLLALVGLNAAQLVPPSVLYS